MSEVADTVLPEDISMPPSQAQSQSLRNPASLEINSSPKSTNNNGSLPSNSGDHLNGAKKLNQYDGETQAMEVDVADTDGDDSQVTSSTENGMTCDGYKSNENVVGKQNTVKRYNTDSTLEKHIMSIKDSSEVTQESIKTLNEELPSIACATISQNLPLGGDSKSSHERSDKIVGNTTGISEIENHASQKDNSIIDQPIISSSGKGTSERTFAFKDEPDSKLREIVSIKAKLAKPSTDMSTNDYFAISDSSKNRLHDDIHSTALLDNKPNGIATESERDDAGIVDLGDDSEEDTIASSSKKPTHQAPQQKNDPENPENAVNLSVHRIKSTGNDSDGPVIIGSDSESEVDRASSQPPPLSKPVEQKIAHPQETADDDDDDCVVIEDDTPVPTHAELTKRKGLPSDPVSNHDDSQPPNKRQRTSVPPLMNQITIKDARSLMPQEMANLKDSNDGLGVYPVNIRTAGPVPGPPKLVPVSNSPNFPLSTLPGLSANTNLLPGLTDDMYVLEAPSFIVPYIYEKPPVDNLREIVKEIEAKYQLSKEDLADADKADEFDMMTEQNKEEREDKSAKKKKKRRRRDDESWSEESEEEDDEEEDDSDPGPRTKVLIKEAQDDLTALKGAIKPVSAVTGTTPGSITGTPGKPGQENYFESPLGKFFMDIGVGLVQEFVQSDLLRLQKRKMRKSLGKNIMEFERAIAALSGNVEASKKRNAPFKFTMKRCEFCNFKSESALSMANHYETPHMNGLLYKCNFCAFEIRNANEIVYHMEAVHNIKARLIKPLPYHQCPNCGFEDNGKAKLARHQPVCAKKFRPELNLAPPHDWEAPAKIPRIKPRHGLVGTATAYQAMAAQAAAQKAALASIQHQQQQAAQARSIQAAALAAQNAANKIRGRPPTVTKQNPTPAVPLIRGPNPIRSPMPTNIVMPNNYQLAGAQIIQQSPANTNAVLAKKAMSGQPSISITPLPRQSGPALTPAASSSKIPPVTMKPGQSPGGNKAQFVICEICDGYIKDLEQLRNHMQWMHKVKIHPKMIYNRPPLNCQKCQFRFFTDQGLERHLLGSHGLVTSSMQEAANKGKDAGRCPVCGRLYQWKLLNHVSRDHHMTLKPAHLSYKCTVCTATFGMYKQFETHVYTAHSTVAKKAMDGKKNHATAMAGNTMPPIGNQRNSFGATGDSLLKPLKINDEITIIPQPASKPRITNMESHVID